MILEHRLGGRCRIDARVSIFHQRRRIAVCKAVDIGFEGICVDAGGVALAPNTLVEVEIVLRSPRHWRLPRQTAMVVHQTADAMGLLFENIHPLIEALVRDTAATRVARSPKGNVDDCEHNKITEGCN